MTNEEAIEKLTANIEADENVMKLFGLKNRPDFKLDILACKSAINALEKQIPKKPIKNEYGYFYCATCKGDEDCLMYDSSYEDRYNYYQKRVYIESDTNY